MGQGPAKAGHHGLRTAYAAGSVAGLTDAQLLDRFMHRRDDGASFEALLARHGPMVLGVCRALLHDEHAADDAFQATFLVLVRRAGSVRVGDSLGRWLYGVAHKVAVQSRRTTAIRNTRECSVAATDPIAEPTLDLEAADLRAAIHEELARLPESSRAAIVLCHLEGLSHEEAAQRLGWPVGTVRSRLARGRDRLRDRLARRGLAPASASAGPMLGLSMSPMVPERLIAATGRAADKLIAGEALSAGIVPASVLTLTSGVLQTMFLTKLKIAALVIASTGALSLSGAFAYQASDKGKGAGAASASAVEQPAEKPGPRTASEILAEEWQRAMDRVSWAEKMQTKGYVSKAAVLDAIDQAKAINDQVGQRLDKLRREVEAPAAAKPNQPAAKAVTVTLDDGPRPKAIAPAAKAEEVDPERWRAMAEQRIARAAAEARNSAHESPKRPDAAIDPSAEELAIQFGAAVQDKVRKENLVRTGAINAADFQKASNQTLILGARIESRMEELRDELERLESQLKTKQAAVNKAKAQVELASAVVVRNKRLGTQHVISAQETVTAETELRVADSQLQIRAAEIQETEVLIKQVKRRLDRLTPVAKMAKAANTSQAGRNRTPTEPQSSPPSAEAK
jgi:RNA polymerase sigma factor (sigma-70 family)